MFGVFFFFNLFFFFRGIFTPIGGRERELGQKRDELGQKRDELGQKRDELGLFVCFSPICAYDLEHKLTVFLWKIKAFLWLTQAKKN